MQPNQQPPLSEINIKQTNNALALGQPEADDAEPHHQAPPKTAPAVAVGSQELPKGHPQMTEQRFHKLEEDANVRVMRPEHTGSSQENANDLPQADSAQNEARAADKRLVEGAQSSAFALPQDDNEADQPNGRYQLPEGSLDADGNAALQQALPLAGEGPDDRGPHHMSQQTHNKTDSYSNPDYGDEAAHYDNSTPQHLLSHEESAQQQASTTGAVIAGEQQLVFSQDLEDARLGQPSGVSRHIAQAVRGTTSDEPSSNVSA